MMYCRAGAIDSWFRAVLTSGLGLALCAMVPVVMASEQVLTLGAYAYLPTAEMERRFQPLASYLSEQVPNVRVELEVHSLESLDQAVQDYHVDLVLTNPRHYISLRASNSLTGVMVTLIKRGVDGTPTRSLGGVIFSRAERDDLASLSDLRGQRIAIPSRLHTGGYLAPVHELDRAGVPLPRELHRVGSHAAVVREVLSGAVDVGFIRTEILEELAASGQLDLNEIKVINRQALGDYPFISSTRLYPEWPLIALPGVDDRTMRLIMAALLALDPDGPVAVQAQIAGFAPPADYLPMEQMLRELRLTPFDQPPEYRLRDLWQDNRWALSGAAIALLTILLLGLLLLFRNRALKQRGRQLASSADQLLALTRIQRVVAEHTAALMSVPAAEQEAAIDRLLEAIGRLLEADRVYLFQVGTVGHHCNNTHEWCAEGISPQRANNQNVPLSTTLWWWETLGAEGRIVIDDVSALPPEAADLQQMLQQQQIRSVFAVSLFRDHPEQGFVGVDLVRERCVWDLARLAPFEAFISALGHALLRWRAEAELSDNQRFLDTLFESIPTPVFCKDVQGRYLRVNRGFEGFLGAERTDLIGKTAFELNPPELAQVYQAQDRKLLDAGGTQHYDSQVLNRAGQLRDVIFDKAVFTDDRGQVVGLIGTVLDVTASKQQERMLKLRAERDEALLQLPQAADELDEPTFMQHAQELAEDLTASRIAFIHFVADDEQTIELVTWSRRTLEHYCKAVYERHYPVRDAGIWADALRRREPVVINDYDSYPHKHGLPEGHAGLERFISVPVTEHGKVVMLTGVGNKVQDYDATDVETLQLISNETWNLVQRRRNQRRLERSASVFLHAREGILVAALDGTIVDVNDAFVLLTGYERDELIGQTPRLFKSGRHDANYYAELWHSLELKGYWRGQIWNRCKDGEQRAQSVTISAVRKAGQEATEFVALYSDITEQLDYQRQLEHAAHFDALTELPNRVLLADRMRQALGRTKRRGLTLAVLYLDLDGFKEVNDRHGHDQGDRLLREVAQRMRGCLREVDTLARLGGDEFVAVLTDLQTEHAVVAQVKRLLAAVSQPIQLEKAVVQLAVSIGVTFYPQRSEVDEDLLLRQADQAMYQAKLAGRNRYLLFDVDQELDQRGRLQSRDRLQWALERGELLFYYQPKVNMRTGNVIGAEALLRWQHPERGLLAPGSFLLQAADERLMIEIGALAVTRALEHLDDWGRDGRMLGLSVNIHAHHLQQAGFVDWLRDVLALHPGFAPGRLTLEVLETSALEDLGLIKRVIEDCSRLGVELSLDDFGTGYSSLTYLRNLPAAEIKVDTSFVRGCLCNPDDLAILEGVLGLATAFQRRVVAEGVETLEHGKLLLALGCELAQGYAIARPMPADEFERWLGGWQVPEVWRQTQTIDREDVAVLFSVIEHCAWVEQWGRFASDGGDAPDTSAAVCRFGLWLRGEAKARYGQRPSFAEIEPLHARIHQVAKALVESAQGEDSPSTGAILDELHSLRDCLYELTLRLLQEKAADHLAHPDAALPWDDVKTAAVAKLKVRAER